MQKYGLKISSEFDLVDKKQIVANGDTVIQGNGVFEVICNSDTKISHIAESGLSHVYAISAVDDISITIDSNFKADKNFDIYHEIIAKNKGVKSLINMNAVLFDNSKLIYRSNLIAENGSTGVGSQKAKVLYVGEGAEADLIPNLDIKSDKFKTSHAVSVSSFNKTDKFYLYLHGFEENGAEEFIIDSFLKNHE
jgi:Fe-S cluster assembly scaffold protein SufB